MRHHVPLRVPGLPVLDSPYFTDPFNRRPHTLLIPLAWIHVGYLVPVPTPQSWSMVHKKYARQLWEWKHPLVYGYR